MAGFLWYFARASVTRCFPPCSRLCQLTVGWLFVHKTLLAHQCCRCRHSTHDEQSDRHSLCSIVALSILFLVLSTTSVLGTANEIPLNSAVSVPFRYCFNFFLNLFFRRRLAMIIGIEYAWNVFPSTPLSSGILLVSNCALVIGIWFGYAEGKHRLKV